MFNFEKVFLTVFVANFALWPSLISRQFVFSLAFCSCSFMCSQTFVEQSRLGNGKVAVIDRATTIYSSTLQKI